MKNSSVLTENTSLKMCAVFTGPTAPLSAAVKEKIGLPCYYLKRDKSKNKLPDWIETISAPAGKDISLTASGRNMEEIFGGKSEIICLDWLDPDFQLPSFGKNRKIIVFDNKDRILCFENGKYIASLNVYTAESARDIRNCRKKSRQGPGTACVLINTGSPALGEIVAGLRNLAENEKTTGSGLFEGSGKNTGNGNYEIFNFPLPDSPMRRSNRTGSADQEFISKRDLIADMTGIVELNEADVRYIFKTGFLSRIEYKKENKLENPERGAYLKNGKKKMFFERESSFSFEGDNVRGLRECLVFNPRNAVSKGRIITDYFLFGDYMGLFVSTFVQYPKSEFEFYDSYNVWETELGIVPQDTAITVSRTINRTEAKEKKISETGIYHFPADSIYIEAGNFGIGVKILKKRGTEAEIFSLAVQSHRKNRVKISLSMLGTYSPVHHSEFHRFSESLSFCIYPGNPFNFPGLPGEAVKEAYAARSWKKI